MKNRLCLLFVFLCCSILLFGQGKKQKYDIAAFLYPAYASDDPRLRPFWPMGIGEWETVMTMQKRNPGHYWDRKPLWGYINEADPSVMSMEIEQATKHGVNVFIFDWYWYDDKPFLERVLNEGFLKARNNEKMKFYLMWANHTQTGYLDPNEPDKSKVFWKGEVDFDIFDRFTDHVIKDYFMRPNYYKIDGMPVFAIYELSTFINGLGGMEEAKKALDHFRNKCVKAGLKGVHLQAILWHALPSTLSGVPGDKSDTQENTVKYLGFNSLTNYQWVHFVSMNQDYASWGEKAVSKYKEFSESFSIPYFPHVSIDWDNNPRFPGGPQPAVSNVTPQKFEKFLYKAKEFIDKHPNQTPLVTINAWNEWGEGSYLEPDTEYKYGFLKAVKKVFK